MLRRVGGYNLDAFVDRADAGQSVRSIMVGSEGTLGIVVEARIRLVPLPAARAVLAVEFEHLLDALAATPGRSCPMLPRPSRSWTGSSSVTRRQSPALDAIRRGVFSDAGGACCASSSPAIAPMHLAGKLRALERDLQRSLPLPRDAGDRSCSSSNESGVCAKRRSDSRRR